MRAATRRPFAFVYAASFLVILGARLHVVAACATDIPFWDEWYADLQNLLLPFSDGRLRAADLFAPHNEHRIVATRLIDLGLFLARGREWHVLTEILLNQLMISAGAALLLRELARGLDSSRRLLLLAGGSALFAIPFDWQAASWGFCSQLYLTLLLAAAALALIGRNTPDRGGFWVGVLCAALGVLCFAGAATTLASAAGVIALRDLRGRTPVRGFAALSLLVVLIALLLITTPAAPANVGLKARSAADFLHAARVVLTWPLPPSWPPLGWLPVLVYVGRTAPQPALRDGCFWTVVGLALWCGAVAAALGYGRAPAPVESRYTVFLVLEPLLNLACLLRLMKLHSNTAPTVAFALGWAGVLMFALLHRVPDLAAGIANKRHFDTMASASVASYLRTGDMAALRRPGASLPYPSAEALGLLLRQATRAQILPASLQQADRPTGEVWRKRMAKTGSWSAIAGLLLSIIYIWPRFEGPRSWRALKTRSPTSPNRPAARPRSPPGPPSPPPPSQSELSP